MKVVENRLDAAPVLRSGGVAVLLTDTLYGLVARAEDEAACSKIRELKGRDADKAMIILVASPEQIWDEASRQAFNQASELVGEGPTSIVVPAGESTPAWLPRSQDLSIAFRLPAEEELLRLLEQTGPLVAPSANPQGEAPAMDVLRAMEYFGDAVDLYVDGGSADGRAASRVIRVKDDGEVIYIR